MREGLGREMVHALYVRYNNGTYHKLHVLPQNPIRVNTSKETFICRFHGIDSRLTGHCTLSNHMIMLETCYINYHYMRS